MGNVHSSNDPIYDVKKLVWFVKTTWPWNPSTEAWLVFVEILVNLFDIFKKLNAVITCILLCWTAGVSKLLIVPNVQN